MTALSRRRLFACGSADPFVIAEIGVNHDGDPARALELVDHAAACGADAIKMQWFRAASLLSPTARLAEYQVEAGETDPVAMLERLELDCETMAVIIERAHERGLRAITTVFTPEDVEPAAELAWDGFKTASPDIINRPLITALLATERPLIVSTGAATMSEVQRAVAWIAGANTALMHCVSAYPTPADHANLRGIEPLLAMSGMPCGYSDHTQSVHTGASAVAIGATLLEKHLTWNTNAPGPDHAASLAPKAFAQYIVAAREARTMLGNGDKEWQSCEGDVRTQSRQSLVLCRSRRAGDELMPEDLTTRRPGSGLSPAGIDACVGRTLRFDVDAGVMLRNEDLLHDEKDVEKRCRVLAITGTRAEYGILRPVLDALEKHAGIEALLGAGGAHLLGDKPTINAIYAERRVDAVLPMQEEGAHGCGRIADALAFSRGVRCCAVAIDSMQPDIVLVLGDRIEAFAAASAASIAGVRVAHIHGGDAASGIADEAMRHAVSKLAHVHFPATEQSASRLLRLGENPDHIHVVGSPAVDGLAAIPALGDSRFQALGSPQFVFLLHPVGESDDAEEHNAGALLDAVRACGQTLLLAPNHDAGRNGIMRALAASGLPIIEHLERNEFIGLLRRVKALVGNSSAGLIECGALGVHALDIGVRQAGRERPRTALHLETVDQDLISGVLQDFAKSGARASDTRFGAGSAGIDIAEHLARIDLETIDVRKQWHD